MKNFINHQKIQNTLEKNAKPDPILIKELLEQAQRIDHKGFSSDQVAALLQNTDIAAEAAIFAIAEKIKERIYGNRMVLFAPMYVSNECINECLYCGFSHSNTDLCRKTLSPEEIREEIAAIQEMGHKRVLAVYGEGSHDASWIKDTIAEMYKVKTGRSGETRRINVNCAPMSVADFEILKAAQIGTYQCFQETYDRTIYGKVHLSGPKSDFLYRLYAHHRSMEAGIDDVGMGVLYGLADYKFDTLALLKHCEQLEQDFGVGPHTLSFPRIEKAPGSAFSENPPNEIEDYELKRIIAIMRLAVPHTGMIISTREPADLRTECLKLGISQLSAASHVAPGSYSDEVEKSQQFKVSDERTLDEVVLSLLENDFIPSFCTGCYRKGRTGKDFMEGLAKTALIKNMCSPNAILTLAEFLRDYASPKTVLVGNALIESMLEKDPKLKTISTSLADIRGGANDIYI